MLLTLHKVLRAGCCGAIAYLILSGCAPQPAYKDVPYTPTGKVNFDFTEPGGSRQATTSSPAVTKQQSSSQTPVDSTALEPPAQSSEANLSETNPSAADTTPPEQGPSEPENQCTGDQSSILTLKTPSYDVTICDDQGRFRYYGTYLPSNSETELPALLSDSGYYIKDGSYKYWVTPRSIAIYQGEELIREEFAQ